ncbi:hypothetical protein [Nocardia jinanensis]|uniref:D-apionate lactonase C-terminal domain-containing protein n=1 Tax=Nocardia jinanensis TaxID=382504 RepID=A0A917RVJ1_9NOCA|nr:hypothetical protein [Nocardia jinanensis]GGL32936.1 hypothetical protein GCM10011588_54770 [Nocardia jinanensis]
MTDALPVTVDWTTPTITSRTTLTTHLWTAPPLQRSSPVHDRAFTALRDLGADYARFLPWWSSPKLSVPELDPPTAGRTSWDFHRLDEFVDDFLAAAEGRPVVANFATIPTWMFETPEPYALQDDPSAIHWDYEQGTEFRDPGLSEVAEHFERIGRWYIDGGFTDQFGIRHESGRDHRFAFWEVLCEPDVGHKLSPQVYTRLYDAVVARLRPLDAEMKFVGLSLSLVDFDPEYFWYFLDPANHTDGTPVDAFSFHFYAMPDILDPVTLRGNLPFEKWHSVLFSQADGFLRQVQLIESIKQRLSPETETHINEIGTFTPDILNPEPDAPEEYWALSAAVVTYLWSRLTELGIELVGVAEFLGYPGMVHGVSLLDWRTGEPNARYRALELLLANFGPGDTLHRAGSAPTLAAPDARIHGQAFACTDGQRRILLVNKYPEPVRVRFTDPVASIRTVDTSTGAGPAVTRPVDNGEVELGPFATAVAFVEPAAD